MSELIEGHEQIPCYTICTLSHICDIHRKVNLIINMFSETKMKNCDNKSCLLILGLDSKQK